MHPYNFCYSYIRVKDILLQEKKSSIASVKIWNEENSQRLVYSEYIRYSIAS